MQKDLTDKAINAALNHDWSTAISCNTEILTANPQDIAALNRLAKAYSESGNLEQAKITYQKVLEIDKFNTIALKNCQNLPHQPKNKSDKHTQTCLNFVEEPGKTKTVSLTRLGEPNVICSLNVGEVVNLIAKNHTITVETADGEHIGVLPDDYSYKLRPFIEAGNRYLTIIHRANLKQIVVFIREIYRQGNLNNTPTFTYF